MAVRLRASLALLLVACGCASDKRLVANATASYVYNESRYEWRCVEVVGPAGCGQFKAVLKDAKREVQKADEVYKIGALPPNERKQLKALMGAMESLP